MKTITLKLIFLLITLLTAGITTSGQGIPQGFNYMAIARDENGDILPGLEMTVRIALLDGDLTKVWEEDHEVTTNETGLFQIIVGKGKSTDSGYAHSFDEIDWTMQPLYISTSVNPNDEFIEMGTAQLFSVPYAMVSNLAYGGVDNPFTMDADTVVFLKNVDVRNQNPIYEEDPLFEVKRQDGKTMFAVYNQGVRINVPLDDAIKGAKGGFSIGGFSGAKENIVQDLFVLNKDSARIYIDQTPDLLPKGAKGGFSVGGFSYMGKEGLPIQEYLSITPLDARINVGGGSPKGAKGGFSVGGFGTKLGESVNFMNITPENYFIGHESGTLIQETGIYNSVIGYQAGKTLTTGSKNVFLGYQAGFENNANYNSFIGFQSGKANTTGTFNTFMGYNSGLANIDGENNVFIGYESGRDNLSGDNNVFLGKNAGLESIGSNNVFIGLEAGMKNQGNDNIFIGLNAGKNLTTGIHNLLIGSSAGLNHTTQEYNVMLGTSAGSNLVETFFWESSFNTFMGINAGYKIYKGKENVFIGTNAGYWIENGSGNTFVGINAGRSGDPHTINPTLVASNNSFFGDMAGFNIQDGDNNVAIGYMSGYSITSGTGNVFIGFTAGSSVLGTESNKLYIDNSSTPSPLIYGDFSANTLQFNGNVGVSKAPAYTLDVAGDVNINSGSKFKIGGTNLAAADVGAEPALTKGNLTATGPISISATRQVIGGDAAISIADASTGAKGAVQLSNSYSGTSTTLAVTEVALSDGLATKVTGNGGAVSLLEGGNILSLRKGDITLDWNFFSDNGYILISNKLGKDIGFWWRAIREDVTSSFAGYIGAGQTEKSIIDNVNVPYAGYEIHLGPVDGSQGWSSVWLQYFNGNLVGHYIQY